MGGLVFIINRKVGRNYSTWKLEVGRKANLGQKKKSRQCCKACITARKNLR